MAGRQDDKGLFKRGRRWWLSIYIPGKGKKNVPLKPPGETHATPNILIARAVAADIRRQVKEDRANLDLGTASAKVEDLIQAFQLVNAYEGSPAQAKDNARLVRALCGEFRANDQYGRFLKTVPRAVHVRQIDLERIQLWFIHLRQLGRSSKTLWNWRAGIGRFCEFLLDGGHMDTNPCRRVKIAKREKLLPRFLSPAEYDQALALAKENGIFAEVATALLTGMRREELRRMAWADVDFDQSVVMVPIAKSKRPRTIPMSEKLRAVLLEQQKKTGARKYVFPGRDRKDQTGMRRRAFWEEALRPLQAAMPAFTNNLAPTATGRAWHLLRHTFASRAVQAGVPISDVMQWLGHAIITTTMVYAHFAPGRYNPNIEKV